MPMDVIQLGVHFNPTNIDNGTIYDLAYKVRWEEGEEFFVSKALKEEEEEEQGGKEVEEEEGETACKSNNNSRSPGTGLTPCSYIRLLHTFSPDSFDVSPYTFPYTPLPHHRPFVLFMTRRSYPLHHLIKTMEDQGLKYMGLAEGGQRDIFDNDIDGLSDLWRGEGRSEAATI